MLTVGYWYFILAGAEMEFSMQLVGQLPPPTLRLPHQLSFYPIRLDGFFRFVGIQLTIPYTVYVRKVNANAF